MLVVEDHVVRRGMDIIPAARVQVPLEMLIQVKVMRMARCHFDICVQAFLIGVALVSSTGTEISGTPLEKAWTHLSKWQRSMRMTLTCMRCRGCDWTSAGCCALIFLCCNHNAKEHAPSLQCNVALSWWSQVTTRGTTEVLSGTNSVG